MVVFWIGLSFTSLDQFGRIATLVVLGLIPGLFASFYVGNRVGAAARLSDVDSLRGWFAIHAATTDVAEQLGAYYSAPEQHFVRLSREQLKQLGGRDAR